MRIGLYLKGMGVYKKDSFIKNNRLTDHLVSKKEIRKSFFGFSLAEDGTKVAYRGSDDIIDNLTFEALRLRMEKGDFLVYDPEGPNNRTLDRFIQLAEKNRYKVYVIDFEDQESDRFDIIKEDAALSTGSIGSRKIGQNFEDMMNMSIDNQLVSVVNVWSYTDKVRYKPINLSKYKKVHHIGDLHGNYRLLNEYIREIKNDEFYIFHGDFIDGGPDSGKVIDYIYSIIGRKNVVVLRGNHEKSLDKMLKHEDTNYRHFEEITKPKILQLDNWREKVKKVIDNLEDVFYYNFNGIEMIASHGGISSYTDDLYKIPSHVLINGAGGKRNTFWVCQTFEKSVKNRPIFQIFGHRSTNNKKEFLVCKNNFNINGDSEKNKNFFKAVVLKKGYSKGYSRLHENVFYRTTYIEEVAYNKYTKKDPS